MIRLTAAHRMARVGALAAIALALRTVGGAEPGPTLEGPAPASKEVVATLNNWSRDSVINFYNMQYVTSNGVPSGWTGNVDTCTAGDTSDAYKLATLLRVNYFRMMTGLPSVSFDAVKNSNCAEAALIVSRNNFLGDDPPNTLPCWTQTGRDAYLGSLRALGIGLAGPAAINYYMQSAGTKNCHDRRWLLYPPERNMGNGAVTPTSGYSPANALWWAGAMGPRPAFPTLVTWPPAGFVPSNLFFDRWSFSINKAYDAWPNDHVDFTNATVAVARNGVLLSTVREDPYPHFNVGLYEGDHTLVFEPSGVNPTDGAHYEVVVNNIVNDGVVQNWYYQVWAVDVTQPSTKGAPALRSVGDAGNGNLSLSWMNAHQKPYQYLGFAYDIYAADWVKRGYNNTMWFPYGADLGGGNLDAHFSGGYHAWISTQYSDPSVYTCTNPWTGILYSGTPHTPINVSAQAQTGHKARLKWKTDIYGTWRYLMIAHNGTNFVNVTGPSGNAMWQAVYYQDSAFTNGQVDLTMPAAGDYTIFIQGQGWLAPYPLGDFGTAVVHVN